MQLHRSILESNLQELQSKLQEMARLSLDGLEQAIESLKRGDTALAGRVIAGDDKINQLEVDIEQTVVVTIATQQPAAGDLRAIIAALQIATELERIGDHAASIAKVTIRIGGEKLMKPLIDIPRMATNGKDMLMKSLKAYEDQDSILAHEVAADDEDMDLLNNQIIRELLAYMVEDPAKITQGSNLLWVTHNLERIGDRATNIAERVLFMKTGETLDLNR